MLGSKEKLDWAVADIVRIRGECRDRSEEQMSKHAKAYAELMLTTAINYGREASERGDQQEMEAVRADMVLLRGCEW